MAASPTGTPDFAFLESVEELAQWHPSSASPLHIANTPLLPRTPTKAPDSSSARKPGTGSGPAGSAPADAASSAPIPLPPISPLVVCHDFKGGYLPHEAVQGVESSEMVYTCEYLQFMDTFIYFSHKRVVIPPASWTNVMHKNGVAVLGTFLVEGGDGRGTSELMKMFDPDSETTNAAFFANQLVEIAKTYGFDGWLLNFESRFPREIFDCFVLMSWIDYLRDEMHRVVPGSQVIWYDSLTVSNVIHYQNGLTPSNQPFFEASDSIFTNYWWNPDRLRETSVNAARLHRKKGVLSGIDVFGRGTYGGGGFHVGRALEAIQHYGLAAVIFGPGWTYECHDIRDFWKNDRKFWIGEEDTHHEASKPIASYVELLSTGSSDFFYTNFSRGFGKRFWIRGELKSSKPWVNLGMQSVLPTFSGKKGGQRMDTLNLELDEEHAFSGGWSLGISERIADSVNNISVCPLYKLALSIRKTTYMRVQYLLRTKLGHESHSEVGIYIDIEQKNDPGTPFRKHLPLPDSTRDRWCELSVTSLLDRLQVKANFQNSEIVQLGVYCKHSAEHMRLDANLPSSGATQTPFLHLGEIVISGNPPSPYAITSLSQNIVAGGRTRLSWKINPDALETDTPREQPFSGVTGPFAYFVVSLQGEWQGVAFATEFALPSANKQAEPGLGYTVDGVYWDGSVVSSVC